MTSLLTTITFLPLIGALLILLFLRGNGALTAKLARGMALVTTLATAGLSLLLLRDFDPQNTGIQFVERVSWLPQLGISYFRGVDGISIWFVVISAFLSATCVLSSFSGITKRVKEFMIAILVLESMLLGVFTTFDLVLFFVFFEGMLIPMFLIVGVWGGAGRVRAAFKFFLYTFAGSVFMLIATIAMVLHAGTADMLVMAQKGFPVGMANWLWLAFFIGFAVKTPMWPFHTWLPDAHAEAPTAGSVALVLLKMGGYGLIRINLQMLPEASAHFAPLVMVLSLIAIIYTSLAALVQSDLRRLIAYSSVAHMGYVTLGIFTGTVQGLEGSMYVMLSHTVVSAALFLCIGVVYDRLHTCEIARFGGLANTMPHYAFVLMIFLLANVGLPGTSGFIGEFLTMQGAFIYDGRVAAVAAAGTVLVASYMLWLYRRVCFGASVHADAAAMPDLTAREYAVFLPLVAFILWMGVHPANIKQVMAPTVAQLLHDTQAKQEVR